MTFPKDDEQVANLFGEKSNDLAQSCHSAMDQLLKAIEVLWGHRCHAVIVAIPMTTDMRPVGMLAMDSFGGNPFGILGVAQYLANSTQENIPRETESLH
jgi:hypothetical protein